MMTGKPQPVSLFIPCLVEHLYPEIGLAMARVLEHLGHSVFYNSSQTCCGQPAYNAGFHDEARSVAINFLECFDDERVIVSPSGSCTAMVRKSFPKLLKDTSHCDIASTIGPRIYEFTEFLNSSGALEQISVTSSGRVGFHNSCHSYRELGLKDEPLDVLNRISGIEIIGIDEEPECCGFGGLFSVKHRPIAESMGASRLDFFMERQVDTIVSNDPGCIMHMRAQVQRLNLSVSVQHITEFLAAAMSV